ncbi:MAG: GNAT family N-acetyltransferase [Lachnospiraceae bacterium]|nr:GNAT family N-acetyltransferase [Lachnospiraceae bacterium]
MKKLDKESLCDERTGIYLREMRVEDTPLIVTWRNSEAVRSRFIYREDFTEEGHLSWIKNMIETGKVIQMMICDLKTDRPLGSVYFRDVDRTHAKAEYGIFIGEEDARGRGVGSAAAKLALRYGFEEEGFHRIFLRVLSDNHQAIGSYENAGFRKEALLREDVFLDGAYRDVILMGILDREFLK